MTFGARLKEERKRLGFKQAEFAALAGANVPKQTLYENDRRSLRAAYLARIAALGVDLVYVLTGRRSEGEWLDEEAARLLSAFLTLPAELQATLARFAAGFEGMAGEPGKGG